MLSQDTTVKRITVHGKILDAATKKPIPFAHIFNESRKFGIISDSSGNIVTNVKVGDTLAVIVLGYLGKKHIISAADTSFLKIWVAPRSYPIAEVSIEIPRNYTDFKEAFMKVDVDRDRLYKDELPVHNPYKTPVLLDTNIINSRAFAIFHPISALYLRNSKEEKSKRKVWELQQQALRQPEVDKKYNDEIITKITGFTDDDLRNFKLWCNFSFNFLYESPQYVIMEEIKIKYEEYLECCINNK